jgi:hypothetical protein
MRSEYPAQWTELSSPARVRDTCGEVMSSRHSVALAPSAPERWQAAFVAWALTAGVSASALLHPETATGAGRWLFFPCPLLKVTDWRCAGCGTTRLLHELLRGNISEALALNPLGVFLVPALCVIVAHQLLVASGRRPPFRLAQPRLLFGTLGILLLYTGVRNIAGF